MLFRSYLLSAQCYYFYVVPSGSIRVSHSRGLRMLRGAVPLAFGGSILQCGVCTLCMESLAQCRQHSGLVVSRRASSIPTSNAEEAEVEQFYEDLQDLLELTSRKDVLFIIGDWIAEVGSQETPGVTGKFGLGGQNEAGQRLIEFCQENTLAIANILFQQHKRRLYTWTSPNSQHQNQIDYILCSQRWRSSIYQQKQDWELTADQIMNSLLPYSDLN